MRPTGEKERATWTPRGDRLVHRLQTARRVGPPLLAATTLGVAARVLAWVTSYLVDSSASADAARFDELVGLGAALAGWAILAWLTLVFVTTSMGLLPGAVGHAARRATQLITPVAVRKAVRLAVGLAVATGPSAFGSAAVASAAMQPELPSIERPGAGVAEPPVSTSIALDPTTVPSPATTGSNQAEPAADGRRTDADPHRIVVRPGDTLWAIAGASLGTGATAAEISDLWPRWYAANRAVIGSDPDLLLPGTVLIPPESR